MIDHLLKQRIALAGAAFLLLVATTTVTAKWEIPDGVENIAKPFTIGAAADFKKGGLVFAAAGDALVVKNGKVVIGLDANGATAAAATPHSLFLSGDGIMRAKEYCNADNSICTALPGESDTSSSPFWSTVILMFDKDCPPGWRLNGTFAGRFPVGAGATGSLFGTDTHVHSIAKSGASYGHGGGNVVNYVLPAATEAATYQPPYENIVFCQK